MSYVYVHKKCVSVLYLYFILFIYFIHYVLHQLLVTWLYPQGELFFYSANFFTKQFYGPLTTAIMASRNCLNVIIANFTSCSQVYCGGSDRPSDGNVLCDWLAVQKFAAGPVRLAKTEGRCMNVIKFIIIILYNKTLCQVSVSIFT